MSARGIYFGDPHDAENRQKAWRGLGLIVLAFMGWQGLLASLAIVMAWVLWTQRPPTKRQAVEAVEEEAWRVDHAARTAELYWAKREREWAERRAARGLE